MPLTYNEWFEENKGIGGTPADYATEYARYYHTELSRPPKDVVEAIEEKYPYSTAINDVSSATRRAHISEVQLQRLAALHGYSLAAGESVRFGNWLHNNSYEARWKAPNMRFLVKDAKAYTTEQLYSLFKKESNG